MRDVINSLSAEPPLNPAIGATGASTSRAMCGFVYLPGTLRHSEALRVRCAVYLHRTCYMTSGEQGIDPHFVVLGVTALRRRGFYLQ